MRILRITPEARTLEVLDIAEPSLDWMQAQVGGYIEALRVVPGERPYTLIHVIGNEEAAYLPLAPSCRLKNLLTVGGDILGPVLISATDEEGEGRDFTDAELAGITLLRPVDDPIPTLVLATDRS